MAAKRRPKSAHAAKPVSGCERPVDVVVGDKRRHAGMVSIENNGRDHRGAVVGTNGMRWVIA